METYRYDIILNALRQEQLILNEKLDRLRELSVVYGKDDYYYNLFKDIYSKELPELVADKCRKEHYPKTFAALMYHLFAYHKPTRTVMLRDNNGNFFPRRINGRDAIKKDEFAIFPMYESREEFMELANEILNSESAKNLSINHTIKAVNGSEIPGAKIVPKAYEFNLRTPDFMIEYKGRKDEVKIAGSRSEGKDFSKMTHDYFKMITDLEFPASDFSDYHRELIESYFNNVEMIPYIALEGGFEPTSLGRYKLDDSSGNIYLRRKKN